MNFLTELVAAFADRHPGCWQSVDHVRYAGKRIEPDWPVILKWLIAIFVNTDIGDIETTVYEI